jgi:predicted Zn finger-like uncharacterized protein
MKFYCDKCQTKYSIADEKVRGKVLKVRCKQCAHVITVREPTAPVRATEPPPAPMAPAKPQQVQWYYSINGETLGPYALRALQQMVARGEVGDAVYIWNETFTHWKPVYEVQEFKSSLERVQRLRPRAQTLGISEALEAIKIEPTPEKSDSAEPEAAEPESAEPGATEDEASRTEPEISQPSSQAASQPVSAPLPGLFARGRLPRPEPSEPGPSADPGRVERLARLRDRLRAPDATADEPQTKQEGQGLGDTEVDLGETVSALSAREKHGETERDAVSGAGRQDASSRAAAQSGPVEDEKVPFVAAQKSPSKSVPVAARSASEQLSKSIIAQLDSIDKRGRGRGLVMGGVAALLLIVVVIVVNVGGGDGREQAHKGSESTLAVGHEGEPGEDDQAAGEASGRQVVELADEVLTREEGEAIAEEERARERGTGAQGTTTRQEAPARTIAPVIAPIDDFEAAMDGATAAAAPSAGLRRASPPDGAVRIEADPRDLATGGAGALSDDDRFSALAAAQTGSGHAPIFRPGEDLERGQQGSATLPIGLSAEQAQQGFQGVRRSIGLCRERHMRRGGTIDVRKIYVSVDVQPSGRVAGIIVEPDSVRDTEFERCMQSHMGRWNFSAFQGDAVTIRAPFVLQ